MSRAKAPSSARNLQSQVLFLDPFSGVSGDMFVGALLDLGLDLARLQSELGKLQLTGLQLSSKRVMRGPISATKFDVETADQPHAHEHSKHEHEHKHEHAHRTFAEIKRLIENSGLSERVKMQSIKVFQKLANAEGHVHNLPPEKVGFHEVGALDSLADIVGACIGLELLNIGEVWCGPVALGSGGTVKCAHGVLPVPAPATLELIKGIPLRQTQIEKELTTPTGAALVAALATRFSALPAMTIARIGYGAGGREEQAIPNVLRAVLGVAEASESPAANTDSIIEIQTNLDDVAPEVLGYLSEALLAAGALDVFFTPIQMKKSRPATLLTVLAEPHLLDTLAGILFKESSTFGLRYQTQSRLKLSRRVVEVPTPFGQVRVKIGSWCGAETSVHPEFDDCRARAQEHGVPIKNVIDAARVAYHRPKPLN